MVQNIYNPIFPKWWTDWVKYKEKQNHIQNTHMSYLIKEIKENILAEILD